MHRHFKQAALAAAVLFAFSANAAEEGTDVIVTATRFSETTLKAPSNVSVITAEDIRNSPATNLPDILNTVAGINVRPLYGNMGIDATVDMRGFGDTASSNTLILLDGQRFNPVDSAGVTWSAIPLGSIKRIEIIRGGGTVLYGDQAVGGVINIITDKSGSPKAAVTATGGSYGYRGVDAEAANGNDNAYFNVAVHYADADGWRQNSAMDQQSLSGRSGLYFSGGEAFTDLAVYKDASGLPSSVLSAAFRNNPTSTRTPKDTQNRDGYRIRPGVVFAFSDTMKLEAEISSSSEKYHSNNVSFASTFDRTRDMLSLTPRLRWQHGMGNLASETVIGVDYYDGRVKANYNGVSFVTTERQSAEQKSRALYLQNTTSLDRHWMISVGARSQRMDQRSSQGVFFSDFGFGPFLSPAFSGSAVRTRNAGDLGVIYQTDAWRLYGKAGTTFRFANTDELFGQDPNTGSPVFAGDLRPQHGNLREVGASFKQGAMHGSMTLYQLNLNDEIGFDSAVFANVNLAPTRRKGVESELTWNCADKLDVRVSYTYTDAIFRDGVYAGNDVPLVPHNKASAQVIWHSGTFGTYSAVVNRVGERVYSGDFANIRGQLPAYATLDLQASWELKPWTISAKLLNAFDKRYATFGGYSTFRNDYFYFPADARSLFVSARYAFQ
jgi:iron complex outermembrane recepter protein